MIVNMNRSFVLSAAIFGLLGVAAGAFGAHLLKGRLSAGDLAIFEVGVRYQMYHALALLAVGVLGDRLAGPWLNASGWLFFFGTVIFSGSLYFLTLVGMRWMGAITPLGGTAFLAGWACLAVAAAKRS